MRHSFGLDVLSCPRCNGRLRFVAVVLDRLGRGAHISRMHIQVNNTDRSIEGDEPLIEYWRCACAARSRPR